MENKCWYCARLGKCRTLSPCTKFIRFREFVTAKEVAGLCGISTTTLYRKLRRNAKKALSWVEEVSGFVFSHESNGKGKALFVLKPNNTENTVKLSRALQKLERKGE